MVMRGSWLRLVNVSFRYHVVVRRFAGEEEVGDVEDCDSDGKVAITRRRAKLVSVHKLGMP